jgi:hypothetical protein
MSYPSGSQGYYPAQQPGGYDAYAQQFGRSDRGARERLQYLRIAVAVLGVASYLFSYGPVLDGHGGAGWAARFAVFAGLLAAFGLAPEQTRKVVAALATVGFLEALSLLINSSSQPGWALWFIISLNGLQALVAIGTVVAQHGAVAAERAAASAYEAYAGYYAQASQYYGQYNQQPQPDALRQSTTARATGQSHQQAAARQPHQAAASSYGSYTEYAGDYGNSGSGHAAPPPQSAQQVRGSGAEAGLPSFGHTQGAVAAQDAEAGHVSRPAAPQ